MDAGTSSALRRWGPLAALVAIAAIIIAVIASGGGDDEEPGTATDPGVSETEGGAGEDNGGDDAGTTGGDDAVDDGAGADGAGDGDDADGAEEPVDTGLPDGVMTFEVAQELGLDVDFGERCDTETGRVKVPNFFAPPCYAPFDGDNGGATHQGVTEDSITIVYWVAKTADPILAYITDAIQNDDTVADYEDTMRRLIVYYETYYETYGRNVELIVYEGTGTIIDEAAARADAVQIAEDIKPFMVWGGPTLTNAFAEELHAREIPCIGCGPGQLAEYYQDNAPYAWTVTMPGQKQNILTAEFVAKQLAGQPAVHAGDEAFHDQERVFGRLWIESSAASVQLNSEIEAELTGYGVELAESVSYQLDPGTIQESAASAIAKMKAAGVTTILFSGDPIAPRDFTREATAQEYFPEWVLGGSVLLDTNVFARTYDQAQWANAFGVTQLAARVNGDVAGVPFIYRWFNGEEPAANESIGVIDPFPALFYAVLAGTGPSLTPETFQQALFAGEPTRRAVSAPSLGLRRDRSLARTVPTRLPGHRRHDDHLVGPGVCWRRRAQP